MARAFGLLLGFALLGCAPGPPGTSGPPHDLPKAKPLPAYPVVQDGQRYLTGKKDGLYRGERSSNTSPRRFVTIDGTDAPKWDAKTRSLIWPLREGERRIYISESLETSDTPVPVVDYPVIQIEGDAEANQAVAQLQEMLRQGVIANGDVAPSPFGAVSTRFGGHVFWDADVWVFPALMFTDPARARTIASYRLKYAPLWRVEAEKWVRQNRPVWGSEIGPLPSDTPGAEHRSTGLKVPWETDVNGNNKAMGNSQYQDHITASVALGLSWAADLGLASEAQVREFRQNAADFYHYRMESDQEGRIHFRNVMGPNEFHKVDDDLYTNMAVRWLFQSTGNSERAEKVIIPRDAEGRLKNASNDPETTYQQVSGLLAAFPLQDPEAEREALSLIERFSPRITPHGPALSASIEATVLARNGKAEEALKRWRESWQPYMDGPLIFREKPLTGDTPFITGAAGCLNTVIYGFCGVRLDRTAQPGAKFEHKLKSGRVVSIRPNLPTGWERVTVPEFWLDGQKHRLEVTRDTVTVTPLP
ncbi:MAG: hypothetical protein ACK4NQ_07780 [Fimbriimonadaceae bacterium]